MKVHEVVHTGIRPFSCNFCLKKYTQKVHLKNHKCISKNVTENNTDEKLVKMVMSPEILTAKTIRPETEVDEEMSDSEINKTVKIESMSNEQNDIRESEIISDDTKILPDSIDTTGSKSSNSFCEDKTNGEKPREIDEQKNKWVATSQRICNICNADYTGYLKDYLKHLEKCQKLDKFTIKFTTCKICTRNFSKRGFLFTHIEKNHSTNINSNDEFDESIPRYFNSKINDSKGNDSKGNDSKGNDSKRNDSKRSDSKEGDSKGNDSKGNGSQSMNSKGNNSEPKIKWVASSKICQYCNANFTTDTKNKIMDYFKHEENCKKLSKFTNGKICTDFTICKFCNRNFKFRGVYLRHVKKCQRLYK